MTPEALAALHARCFDDTPRPWTAAEFAGLLAQAATLLVHRPQGFALGRSPGPEAELLTLAVAPEARRRGHGAELMAALEAEAVARGARQLLLEVAESNTAARALYAALGYLPIGRRRGYYARRAAPAVDGLVLAKALAVEPDPPGATTAVRRAGKTI